MLNLDPAKLVVILVLALVVMGPEKMQSSARHFGAVWRSITEFRENAERQVRDALPDLGLPSIPSNPRAAVSGFVTGLLTAPGSEVENPSTTPVEGEVANDLGEPGRRRAVSVPALRADDVSMN